MARNNGKAKSYFAHPHKAISLEEFGGKKYVQEGHPTLLYRRTPVLRRGMKLDEFIHFNMDSTHVEACYLGGISDCRPKKRPQKLINLRPYYIVYPTSGIT